MNDIRKKIYHICFAPDSAYSKHCAVSMASISANAANDEYIKFYIFHNSEIGQENIARLAQIDTGRKNFEVIFTRISDEEFAGFPDYGHQPVWYRFKIASLIPEASKVLYLDCDIVANTSLGELFAEDIDSYAMGAVKDNIHKKLAKKYKLPKGQPYFNSGVILVNCDYWRKYELEKQFFCFIKEDPQRAWLLDQNILNMLFGSQTKFLNLKYNFQYVPCLSFESCFIHEKKEYKEALQSPVIIHYFGTIKPWLAGIGALHPMQAEYLKYLQLTHWKMSDAELESFTKENERKRLRAKWYLYWRAVKRNPQFLLKPYFWGRILMSL